MNDNSILSFFNLHVFHLLGLPAQVWDGFEMLICVPIFFLAIWRRVYFVNSHSAWRRATFFGVSAGQLTIYLQMIASIMCCVDGYELYLSPLIVPHITSIMFLITLLLSNLSIFLTYDKIPARLNFTG